MLVRELLNITAKNTTVIVTDGMHEIHQSEARDVDVALLTRQVDFISIATFPTFHLRIVVNPLAEAAL